MSFGLKVPVVASLVKKDFSDGLAGWQNLLKEIVSRGADLHPVSVDGRTPFLSLLEDCFRSDFRKEELHQVLGLWCKTLEECGIDLMTYGAKETALYQRGPAIMFRDWKDLRHVHYHVLKCFKLGRSWTDWSIDLEEIDKAGVEDFDEYIPGGWIEDKVEEEGPLSTR